jgi:transposase
VKSIKNSSDKKKEVMKKSSLKTKKISKKEHSMTSIYNSELKLKKSQPIFMGIDVHKKRWSVCIVHSNTVIKKFSMESNMTQLEEFTKRYKGHKIYSAYEAGFSGFHIHRSLEKIGVENIVTSPSKMPTIVGDLVKTDKIDSLKIATLLSKQMLKPIYVPSVTGEDFRQLMRTRYQFSKEARTKIQHIKSLLIRFGKTVDSVGLPKKAIDAIREMDLPLNIKKSLDYHIETYLFLSQKIKALEKDAEKFIVPSAFNTNYNIIKSIPGVGHITASCIVGEIGDWNRFSNERQISAFFGLTPSEYSSGEYIHRGRITGQGSALLRSLMIEASWVLIEKDPKMNSVFNRLVSNTKGKKKAIVGVARKLVCIMFAMIKNQRYYELGHYRTEE